LDQGSDGGTGGNGGEEPGVVVQWLGHAAFLITSPGGVRILTDPYGGTMGYGNRRFQADLVTVSHEHWDHNSVASVEGDPEVLRGLADGDWAQVEKTLGDVTVRSIPGTYHDNVQGASGRGKNGLFLIEIGDLRLLHLGDLGEIPSVQIIERVGRVDVLFIPVGGVYTIDAAQATRVAELLGARIVIPMHYRTPAIADWQISDEGPFLEGKSGVRVLESSEVTLRSGDLPEDQEIWVLQPGS
jgi:L-ascorbate metabolism protein UlaG (beta-lactamase superfamily)